MCWPNLVFKVQMLVFLGQLASSTDQFNITTPNYLKLGKSLQMQKTFYGNHFVIILKCDFLGITMHLETTDRITANSADLMQLSITLQSFSSVKTRLFINNNAVIP